MKMDVAGKVGGGGFVVNYIRQVSVDVCMYCTPLYIGKYICTYICRSNHVIIIIIVLDVFSKVE